MTVTSTLADAGPYTADGVTTSFPFGFAAQSGDEVAVVRRASSGAETVMTDYSIVLNTLSDGGTVNFSVAPVAGDPIYLYSNPSFEQQINFSNQGSWSPTSANIANDRDAIRDIFLKSRLARALLAPVGEVLAKFLPSAAVRANQYLAFDGNGDPIAVTGGGSKGDPGSPGEGYATRTAMAARLAPALLDDVYLTEKGREGKFVVDLASNWTAAITADATRQGVLVPSTADATKVYVRADIWRHFWDIRWFGALADDAGGAGTDCLGAINAFLATAAAVGKLRTNDATFNGLIGCDFPGYYFCSGLINLKTPVHLRGLSGGMGGVTGGSRIRFPAGVAGIVINRSDTTGYTATSVAATTGADGSKIEGISLWCGNGTRPAAGTTHGILVRARCTIIEPYVAGFAGSGIAIYADNGNVPMWGNASGTHVRGGRSVNNGVHGLHIKGSDANACDVTGLDTFGNGQWGKLDESFLGTTIVGGQDAGDGLAAYVCFPAGGQVYAVVFGQEGPASTTQPGTNANVWHALPGVSGGYPTWVSGMTVVSGGPMALRSTSVAIQPYFEGAQGPVQIGGSSLLINGLPGPSVDILGPRIRANLGNIQIDGTSWTVGRARFDETLWFGGNTAFPGTLGGGFNGFIYRNASDGLSAYGLGSVYDFNIFNNSGTRVFSVPTGTQRAVFGGDVELASGHVVKVNGVKVLSAQAGAISNGVNAAGSTPTQAEFNALVTVVNAVLAAMRSSTGHGLISG